jgi:hypothetical protein
MADRIPRKKEAIMCKMHACLCMTSIPIALIILLAAAFLATSDNYLSATTSSMNFLARQQDAIRHGKRVRTCGCGCGGRHAHVQQLECTINTDDL